MARDGHVRVLPLHVANKIAAGEVVERPASVVKELVENAVDAGAHNVRITVTQGGRKLASVQDDGCGMTKDDALLALERQATSKIRDVDDIERIDTLGFRGEAIPSIASVSRFTLVTRRADADEGTRVTVNAGILAEVSAAGCPPGTLVEVRDLFCNVPARRKFLRAFATEEAHVKTVFTIHALAHPAVGFTLVSDGRELYRLPPAASVRDRVRELFGTDFAADLVEVGDPDAAPAADGVRVTGFVERPNLNTPTRRDQYVFVNGRPATAPAIAYALKEAYPRRPGDLKPAVILFIDLPPEQVDVNVHPTKREVRFRDNAAVRTAIITAIEHALGTDIPATTLGDAATQVTALGDAALGNAALGDAALGDAALLPRQWTTSGTIHNAAGMPRPPEANLQSPSTQFQSPSTQLPAPSPVAADLPLAADGTDRAKPWTWFKFLAMTASGYLLVETDAGVVTVNPLAARERIAYEALLNGGRGASQALLLPETVKLSPPDFARVSAARETLAEMGFAIEPFGTDTFKIDEVPQLLGNLSASAVLATIARDLAEGARRGGEKWREELIAKSVARSFAGASFSFDEKSATQLVERLAACRMPYVCPRGKPIMIFTSTRELNRKFARE